MDPHQQLLREVHDHFLTTGEWPCVVPLQMKLRQLGHIPRLAAEIGREKISCDNQSQGGVCQLTLRGLAEFEDSNVAIAQFLTVVRALVRHSIVNGTESANMVDLISDLGLSESETRRISELIRIAPGLWSGLSSSESGVTSITPNANIWYFEDVNTLAEFYAALDRAREDERATLQQLRSPGYTPPPPSKHVGVKDAQKPPAIKFGYVNETRLEELRAIKSADFDLRRLIALCEELNVCAEHECVFATAMLTRTIVDYVPPIFRAKSFAEVTSNYPGAKSFKDSMQHLSNSARRIADAHLHIQIRSKESLPTATQVNFSRDLDVLLAEIVRILT